MKPSKELALLIVSGMKKKKGKEEDKTAEMAGELRRLLKKGSDEEFGKALKNFIYVCQNKNCSEEK